MAWSLLIFSDVTFKMAARRPYWISRFPDSNFSLALNIKSKLHWHITCVFGKKPIDFQQCHFQNGRLAAILVFFLVSKLCSWHGFRIITRVCFGISISNFICMLFVAMHQSLFISRYVAFKMAAWQPYLIFFNFLSLTLVWLWISSPNFSSKLLVYMGRSLLIFSNVTSQMAAWQPYWFFSCDQAALWMVFSVRPSVCPSHLFDYVPFIVSSWNFQELLPMTEVTSMQKFKVRGQISRSHG